MDNLIFELAIRIAAVGSEFGLLTEPKANYSADQRETGLGRLDSSAKAIERLLKRGASDAIGTLDERSGRDWILQTLEVADEARTVAGSLNLCKRAAERRQHIAHDSERIHRIKRELSRRWLKVNRLVGTKANKAQAVDAPPDSWREMLSPQEWKLACQLWQQPSKSFTALHNTAWAGKTIQDATIEKTVMRANSKLMEAGYTIVIRNRSAKLEKLADK